MADLLLGSKIREQLTPLLINKLAALRRCGVVPTLAVLRVGAREDDIAYENSLKSAAAKLGLELCLHSFDEDAPQEHVIGRIQQLNADESVHGVLIFRPLPAHIDDRAVRNALDPAKDTDGITDASGAALYRLRGIKRISEDEACGLLLENGYVPCTAEAVMRILDYYEIPLAGRRAAIVGRSDVIGKPVSLLLLARNATITICHSATEELADILRGAEVVVVAAGIRAANPPGDADTPGGVTLRDGGLGRDYFSAGQTVIDVGIHSDADGRLYGDVDSTAAEIVKKITPVPGGVGGVTTLCLLEHVIRAAEISAARADR